MALYPSNSSSLEQLALNGLTDVQPVDHTPLEIVSRLKSLVLIFVPSVFAQQDFTF